MTTAWIDADVAATPQTVDVDVAVDVERDTTPPAAPDLYKLEKRLCRQVGLAIVDYKTSNDPRADDLFAFQLAIYASAGRGEGLERLAVPCDERLALICDADRPHVRGPRAGRIESVTRGVLHRRPDLERVVLDPRRLWVVLRDLAVALASNLAIEPDRDRCRPGRAFVQAKHDLRHG